jgi:DNA-binding GntR family transcriptional regulator
MTPPAKTLAPVWSWLIATLLHIVYTIKMSETSYSFLNPLSGRQNSPEIIVESLRRAIIEGQLSPGESLGQENLAKHFAVSRIPIREALRQLESEGWIVLQPNRGARVTILSAEEVREIYEVRASLEATALRLAAPHHTEQSLKDIAAILRRSHATRDQSLYVQHNRQFHLALYAPAQRPRLFALIDSLHSQGERYLRLKLGMPAHKQQSDDEHEQLFNALRAGNLESAVQILEAHLLQTGNLLAGYLTQRLAKPSVDSVKRRRARAAAA